MNEFLSRIFQSANVCTTFTRGGCPGWWWKDYTNELRFEKRHHLKLTVTLADFAVIAVVLLLWLLAQFSDDHNKEQTFHGLFALPNMQPNQMNGGNPSSAAQLHMKQMQIMQAQMARRSGNQQAQPMLSPNNSFSGPPQSLPQMSTGPTQFGNQPWGNDQTLGQQQGGNPSQIHQRNSYTSGSCLIGAAGGMSNTNFPMVNAPMSGHRLLQQQGQHAAGGLGLQNQMTGGPGGNAHFPLNFPIQQTGKSSGSVLTGAGAGLGGGGNGVGAAMGGTNVGGHNMGVSGKLAMNPSGNTQFFPQQTLNSVQIQLQAQINAQQMSGGNHQTKAQVGANQTHLPGSLVGGNVSLVSNNGTDGGGGMMKKPAQPINFSDQLQKSAMGATGTSSSAELLRQQQSVIAQLQRELAQQQSQGSSGGGNLQSQSLLPLSHRQNQQSQLNLPNGSSSATLDPLSSQASGSLLPMQQRSSSTSMPQLPGIVQRHNSGASMSNLPSINPQQQKRAFLNEEKYLQSLGGSAQLSQQQTGNQRQRPMNTPMGNSSTVGGGGSIGSPSSYLASLMSSGASNVGTANGGIDGPTSLVNDSLGSQDGVGMMSAAESQSQNRQTMSLDPMRSLQQTKISGNIPQVPGDMNNQPRQAHAGQKSDSPDNLEKGSAQQANFAQLLQESKNKDSNDVLNDNDDASDPGKQKQAPNKRNHSKGKTLARGRKIGSGKSAGKKGDSDNASAASHESEQAEGKASDSQAAGQSTFGQRPYLEGTFAGGWQSNADLPDRRRIIYSIVKVIERMRPDANQMSQKLPLMAKKLEEHLYRSARTKEEYVDLSTLKKRLQKIAHLLGVQKSISGPKERRRSSKDSESSSQKSSIAGMKEPSDQADINNLSNTSEGEGMSIQSQQLATSGNGMGLNQLFIQQQLNGQQGTLSRDTLPFPGRGRMNDSSLLETSESPALAQLCKSAQDSTGSGSGGGASGGGSGTDGSKAQKKKVIRQQQQRLLLLRHASKCTLGPECKTKFCPQMVTLWKHMKKCRDKNCKTAHCLSSRCVLNHYRICKGENRTASCEVCAPVMKHIRSQSSQTGTERGLDSMDKLANQTSAQHPKELLISQKADVVSFAGSSAAKQNAMNRSQSDVTEVNSSMNVAISASQSKQAQPYLAHPGGQGGTESSRKGESDIVSTANELQLSDKLPQETNLQAAEQKLQQQHLLRQQLQQQQAQLLEQQKLIERQQQQVMPQTQQGQQLQQQQALLQQLQQQFQQQQKLLHIELQRQRHILQQGQKQEQMKHTRNVDEQDEVNSPSQEPAIPTSVLSTRLDSDDEGRQSKMSAVQAHRRNERLSAEHPKSASKSLLRKGIRGEVAKPGKRLDIMAVKSGADPDTVSSEKKASGDSPKFDIPDTQPSDKISNKRTIDGISSSSEKNEDDSCRPAPSKSLKVERVSSTSGEDLTKPEDSDFTKENETQKDSKRKKVRQQGLSDQKTSLIPLMTSTSIKTHLDSLQETTHLTPRQISQKCLPVVRKLMNDPCGWVFSDPVDPIELGLPDYFDVIKNPMDLGSVEKRLENGVYSDLESFERETKLVFENAVVYNGEKSDVGGMAKKLLSAFEREFKSILKGIKIGQRAKKRKVDACSLCGSQRKLFEPVVLYCSGTCGMQRIGRNAPCYTDQLKQNHWCVPCYGLLKDSDAIILDDGNEIRKNDLQPRKNDGVREEPWVQCDNCHSWVHQICALFNQRKNNYCASSFTCPKCHIKALEPGQEENFKCQKMKGAADLPHCKMSEAVERGVLKLLESIYSETAKERGCSLFDVEKVEGISIRVVSNTENKQIVQRGMQERYSKRGYPSEFAVRSKCLVLFQKIHGVDVLLFGMFVHEYGDDCPAPNRRRVYISSLDSVHFCKPKKYRTAIYHGILVEYLRFVKGRGFHTAHIWSCPPSKGDDCMFYCHPKHQLTPGNDMLCSWYHDMLEKAKMEGVVLQTTNLYDEYFNDNRRDADLTCLPYFEGDYIPGEIEDIIGVMQNEESIERTSSTGTKGTLEAEKKLGTRSNSGEPDNHGCDKVMLLLGQALNRMKQNFIVVHLRSRRYAEAVGRGEDVSKYTEGRGDLFGGKIKIGGKDSSILHGGVPSSALSRQELCYGLLGDKHFGSLAVVTRGDNDRPQVRSSGLEEMKRALSRLTKRTTKDSKSIGFGVDEDPPQECECFGSRQKFLNFCKTHNFQFDELRRAKHSTMMILFHLRNFLDPLFLQQCKPVASRHSAKFEERTQRIKMHLDVLNHAAGCVGAPLCSMSTCKRMKMLFEHINTCSITYREGCEECVNLFLLSSLHARLCSSGGQCPVPFCDRIRQRNRRISKQQQLVDGRRRKAENKLYGTGGVSH